MQQTAIFVDAGYLYAQGSTAVSGSKRKRQDIQLNLSRVLTDLKALGELVAPRARLLRIYWYDGLTRGGRLNREQASLATTDDVKLRLGMVNSMGEQKGVDSLIVTDLIELARNRAITDAIIVSGDEDIRVGVQVAQTFGVRVHLLGMEPARGSQSPDLVQEADTTHEWQHRQIGQWLSVLTVESSQPPGPVSLAPDSARSSEDMLTASFEPVFEEVLGKIPPTEVPGLVAYIDANRQQLPAEFDRPMLGKLKALAKRELTSSERARFRRHVIQRLRLAGNHADDPEQ